MKYVFLVLGGSSGAFLRYISTNIASRAIPTSFPIGTLLVNILGSFFIGLLYGLFESFSLSENYRIFIFTGLLGSFTTFSTFSYESFSLLKTGEFKLAFLNIFGSVFLGLIAVFFGYFISSKLN
jgi:fluoride exporter